MGSSQSQTNTPIRILIVEDEGIIADHIASMLVKAGYEVAGIAESSEGVFRKVAESKTDLILMDIRIKGALDGIQTAAKLLRERFDIPIIYLTAYSDHETVDRAKTTGAFSFLTKPVQPSSLAIAIEMAIYKHAAERAVRDQRAWMGTVLGTMADALAVIDRDGELQFLNAPAEELTGWKNDDARDKEIALVLPLTEGASGLPANHLYDSCADLTPRLLPAGLTASARSGKRFPIEGEIAPSVDGTRVAGAVITFRDATARLAHEKEMGQRDRLLAVGRLAAGITHDFNGLMFTILGYVDEMRRVSDLSDGDSAALNEIQWAAENAARLTRELMKFSGKQRVAMQEVNLNDMIRAVVAQDILSRLPGALVEWRLEFDPNLGKVLANEGQLRQVLLNLAANARHSMPDGGTFTLATMNVDAPNTGSAGGASRAFVQLTATDTGAGMSAEAAERLFEPFFVAREPGARADLGLAIIQSTVLDLGGSIRADCGPDSGRRFTLRFPRVADPNGIGKPSARGVSAAAAELPGGAGLAAR